VCPSASRAVSIPSAYANVLHLRCPRSRFRRTLEILFPAFDALARATSILPLSRRLSRRYGCRILEGYECLTSGMSARVAVRRMNGGCRVAANSPTRFWPARRDDRLLSPVEQLFLPKCPCLRRHARSTCKRRSKTRHRPVAFSLMPKRQRLHVALTQHEELAQRGAASNRENLAHEVPRSGAEMSTCPASTNP
jgi:hypothetical protein